MVLFLLYMKADLEGVASVSLRKDADLMLTVKNPLSDFEVREKVVINPSATVEQDESSSRDDPHHLSLKWEGSKKQSTLTVLSVAEAKTALKKKSKKKNDEFTPRDYTVQDAGAFAPILCIECRGLEPTAYFPGDEFVVTSEGGTVFAEEVDLSEGDWADYDAEYDAPVALSEVEFKWEAV
jgi:Eukaryotic protein of unknown function (DUF866)